MQFQISRCCCKSIDVCFNFKIGHRGLIRPRWFYSCVVKQSIDKHWHLIFEVWYGVATQNWGIVTSNSKQGWPPKTKLLYLYRFRSRLLHANTARAIQQPRKLIRICQSTSTRSQSLIVKVHRSNPRVNSQFCGQHPQCPLPLILTTHNALHDLALRIPGRTIGRNYSIRIDSYRAASNPGSRALCPSSRSQIANRGQNSVFWCSVIACSLVRRSLRRFECSQPKWNAFTSARLSSIVVSLASPHI